MSELVSIIMPSYNAGQFIKEAIESVLAQSYSNWELIIVDDCSKDNTDDIRSVRQAQCYRVFRYNYLQRSP